MVYLPTNVLTNVLEFCIGFHQSKAEVIARCWLEHYRSRIGRSGRPKRFETSYGWASNGFEPRAQAAYAHAYNHRIQKKGQLVTVANGKYLGTTAAIVGLTECMVHLVGVDGRRFRVSRCSVSGAFHWKCRNKLGEPNVQIPSWWGRWLFTGIRV